jgi:hypothetical protein
MEKKLKYPELEQGNYEAQTEAIIKQSKDMADTQEKRAKRDRDMAIFGDIANLVSKGAAMHGGAWKMNKDESMAAQGNAKLRALQESNSKQLAEYAKMRMNAADADRKERNAQKVAEYNAEVEQYKRDLEAEKYAKEQERKDRQEARQTAESTAKINYYNNGGRRTTGGGSPVNRDVYLLNDDGSKEEFRHADDSNNVLAAYWELMRRDPDFAVMKESPVYEYRGGRYVPEINNDGTKKTTLVVNEYPSTKDALNAIAKYNAAKTKAAVPAKKANPMGNGKKKNPMN